MEENLLNELENFSSVKYLENVTNNSGANGFCSDDDQDNSLFRQLAIKDRQLILAAKCGKVLLEQKEELERQMETLNRDFQNRIDTLEQERHELRLLLEQVQAEWETKTYEMNEDKTFLRRQFEEFRREQRINDEKQCSVIQEITENNLKLCQDLQKSRTSEIRLEEQLKLVRKQAEVQCQINLEQTIELNQIKQQLNDLQCQQMQLELDNNLLVDERDALAHKLDETYRRSLLIEDEFRSLKETQIQSEKELNEAHELIEKLSQNPNRPERVGISFFDELNEDFRTLENHETRFNSTVIEEEETDQCPMNEDPADSSALETSSKVNEKCLLDELLQTDEFKKEIVFVYKQLRSLCTELIYLDGKCLSLDNSHNSSLVSESSDKVYDQLQKGCLISILFELKTLIKKRLDAEEMFLDENSAEFVPHSQTILPSPSLATINSYASAFDDVNLLIFSSPPPPV